MAKEDIVAYQFKPGQSGNLSGRPKGRKSYATLLREALEEEVQDGDKKVKLKELFFKRVLKKAIEDGSEKMIEMIMAYMDGKPVQRIAGEDGDAVEYDINEVIFRQVRKVYGKKTIKTLKAGN